MSIHLKGLKKGMLGEVTLIVGDPNRVKLISESWVKCEKVVDTREFIVVIGEWHNHKVSICSTGIGIGSTEIAVTELIENGSKMIIRCGGCGAWAEGIEPGDIILNTSMARSTGIMSAYVSENYPASADPLLLTKIYQKMKNENMNVHVGIGLTSETYYNGQGRVPAITDSLPINQGYMDYWVNRGIKNCEMETAALYILGNIYNVPVANSLVVHISRKKDKWTDEEKYKKLHRKAAEIVLSGALNLKG
ncbi:nucleoside phosphorylase [Enterococcus songbeiensis]|uniref:nucleoside phosphorylase n=1 Tax=Enterococcus songbeiensis TaxID=2559927 RepID=UPI0010F442A1|nr:nucleoside phosphorylase [Enterococcus songbeiensis]